MDKYELEKSLESLTEFIDKNSVDKIYCKKVGNNVLTIILDTGAIVFHPFPSYTDALIWAIEYMASFETEKIADDEYFCIRHKEG